VDRIDAKDFAIGLEKVKNELSGHLALSARAHSFQPVFGVLKEVMDVPPARFGVGLQRGSLLVWPNTASVSRLLVLPILSSSDRACTLVGSSCSALPNRGASTARGLRHRGGLHLQLFLVLFLALGAFAAELRGTGRYRKRGVGHPHNLISDPVGLVLKRIVDRADR
jgi:hypothetical protein